LSREIIYGLTVSLLLAAVLTALNVKPVEAWTGGTVTIKVDGSIYPSDAPITTSDYITYRLTDDVQITSGNGIVIERDNIILNGSGYSITALLSIVRWKLLERLHGRRLVQWSISE
jgi:hypothetical protein